MLFPLLHLAAFFLLYPAHMSPFYKGFPTPTKVVGFIHPFSVLFAWIEKSARMCVHTHAHTNKIKDRLNLAWPRNGEAIWGHGKDEPRMVAGMSVGLACLWSSTEISLVVWEYRQPCLALRVGCGPWLKSQAGEDWLDVGGTERWLAEAVSAVKTVVNFACRISLRDSEGGGIISCSLDLQ